MYSLMNQMLPKMKQKEIIILFERLFLALFGLFDLILYVPSTIFQLCRDRSSWVEPDLS